MTRLHAVQIDAVRIGGEVADSFWVLLRRGDWCKHMLHALYPMCATAVMCFCACQPAARRSQQFPSHVQSFGSIRLVLSAGNNTGGHWTLTVNSNGTRTLITSSTRTTDRLSDEEFRRLLAELRQVQMEGLLTESYGTAVPDETSYTLEIHTTSSVKRVVLHHLPTIEDKRERAVAIQYLRLWLTIRDSLHIPDTADERMWIREFVNA